MVNKLLKLYKNSAFRHYPPVVAFAVAGVLLGAIAVFILVHFSTPTTVVVTETSTTTQAVVGPVLDYAEPSRLRIPSLGVDTTFVDPLGVNDDQTVEVPAVYDEVGWYKYGPTPGELGPAVILGHVDSFKGPAVFFSLGQLEPGDEIEIDRLDGTTAVFEVIELERHLQSGFPTEKVYGNLDYAGLRLVTCSGVFDHGVKRYSHNLIVYAKLKE